MKHRLLVIAYCTLGFFQVSLWSPLWPHEKPLYTENNKNRIEGIWTRIYNESGGEFFSTVELEKESSIPRGPGFAVDEKYIPFLWKITKEKIEIGPDNKGFPLWGYSYQLNSDGKAGNIDMHLLYPKKWEQVNSRAFFF